MRKKNKNKNLKNYKKRENYQIIVRTKIPKHQLNEIEEEMRKVREHGS